MIKPSGNKRPHGQMRQSQIVSTFGPGAMVDLPNHAVLVAGLEHWKPGGGSPPLNGEEIYEPRLIEGIKRLLALSELRLFTPPPDQEDPTSPPTGITVWQFPEWFITQDIERPEGTAATTRARLLLHRTALTKGKYLDSNKRRRPVVPVRFVRACRAGHIGDVDWYAFVHEGKSDCRRQLWIDERGTSGDLTEVWVRCECGRQRNMAQASILSNRALGSCDGQRLWLGPYSREDCHEPSRLLIRTASNAYFAQKLSVISLPDRDQAVKDAVDQVWEFLGEVEHLEQLQYERRKTRVRAVLEGISDDEVFEEIVARRGGADAPAKPVKQAELETLVAARDELGVDRPDGTFFARSLPGAVWHQPWMKTFERIVLVHRLREVMAQVGFTRFEPAGPDIQGELEMGVQRATLAREVTWLPAIENRGEGIFLQFRAQAVEEWLGRPEVETHGKSLRAGFEKWRSEHVGTQRQFPGLPYMLLHSFSHLLITAVSLECGYPASSIRERVYALPGVGYGVLLYTGSADAEGTLGGLVEVGRNVAHHVNQALKLGELCSNDPVCAQHDAANPHEARFLHGAACHGCLLIGETSCEQHNDFLDRALVTPTVERQNVAFFHE